MSEYNQLKLTYIVYIIGEFANRHNLSDKQAFIYLKRYEGLAFLDECYQAEHTVSAADAVEDLTAVCRRNGGGLA